MEGAHDLAPGFPAGEFGSRRRGANWSFGRTPGRRFEKREVSAVDTLTSYVLFFFVAASVTFGVYDTGKIVSHMDAIHSAWVVIGNIWGWVFCADILLFVVNGPMVLLGVWIASKIVSFPVVSGAYLRSWPSRWRRQFCSQWAR